MVTRVLLYPTLPINRYDINVICHYLSLLPAYYRALYEEAKAKSISFDAKKHTK